MERSLILFAVLALTGCGPKPQAESRTQESWDNNNDPVRMGVTPVPWGQVPARGATANNRKLWSGDGWATHKGGVAFRWTLGERPNPVYTPLSSSQLASLSEQQLASLSPAEKFDIYMGRTQFPLTRQVLNSVATEQAAGPIPAWHGICHGWAAASTQEAGPGESLTVRLNDGRRLFFRQDDLEALLSYAYSDLTRYSYQMIGSRCDIADPRRDANGRPINTECRDTNPAALHLALGQVLGQRGESLIIDMEGGEQIWNFPVRGYQFQYGSLRNLTPNDPLYSVRAPGTRRLLDVRATIDFIESTRVGDTRNGVRSVNYDYTLELDANDVIVGGEWRGNARPDFLWRVTSAPRLPEGNPMSLAAIQRLRDQSLSAQPNPDPDPTPDPTDYPPIREGSREALGVIRLVNTVAVPYLQNVVGISAASAARLGAVPRFNLASEIAARVTAREMWILLDFAIDNGYVQ